MLKFLLTVGLLACATFASAASIEISNREHKLTFHADDGSIKTYPVAVGRMGAAVRATFIVGDKQQNPSWTPTPNMIKHEHMSGHTIPPGPRNPLGPRIIHLNRPDGQTTYYGVHGTNAENSVGKSVSHGCFRMHHNDIIELYSEVPKGTVVTVR